MSSVCPSVTLVYCDNICWNSSKIISQLVSVGRSFSADSNIMDLLQGEHPEIWAQSDPPPVDLSVGDIRSQIAAEWLQIDLVEPIGNHHRFFEWCHGDPLRPPLPQNGGYICPHDTRMAISPQRVIRSTSCLVIRSGFRGQRIERRYLRFEQIQDGGRSHLGKI